MELFKGIKLNDPRLRLDGEPSPEMLVPVVDPITGSTNTTPLSGIGTGGGSGNGITFRLKSNTALSLVAAEGNQVILDISWSSIDSTDGSDTGPGSMTLSVNGSVVQNKSIAQGQSTFNITSYLISGANTALLIVTDSYGNTRTLNFSITYVSLYLSSSYDHRTINTGDITFRFTPIGAVEKTIHFKLDGVELDPMVTSLSNRQLTYLIAAQPHGVHHLDAWMTAEVLGDSIESNHLSVDIISVETGHSEILLASPFSDTTVQEYATLQIPFIAYNPASNYTEVTFKVNNQVISVQSADRSLNSFSYKVISSDPIQIELSAGTALKSFDLTVIPSEIDVPAETIDLQLYLTAQNRNNNEESRDQWNYGSYLGTLAGFDFINNGWLTDSEGSSILRVANGARVNIPIQPFATDLKISGLTLEIEFKTFDVKKTDAVLVECFNQLGVKVLANSAIVGSTITTISTQFGQNDRVRLSFVINKSNDNRLIYIYVNGIISGVAQYTPSDSFVQLPPHSIVIGSDDCGIDIYNIRVYNNNLNNYQILNNYIADMDDLTLKAEIYNKNQIFDDFGQIALSKVLELLPCMIYEGPLPQYKGDKQVCNIYYIDNQNPANSFTSEGLKADVQGSSSQYYPRKNLKLKFKKFILNDGTEADSYSLGPGYIPVPTYTMKADFMDSSSSHNTGTAMLITDALNELGFKVPPQLINPMTRTNIVGKPIVMFQRDTPDGDLVCIGKYNFNTDKGSYDNYGYDPEDEVWSLQSNTADNTLFLGSDFTSVDQEGNPLWQTDFDITYPDDFPPVDNLQALQEWIVSTKGNPTKFKTEAPNYFNVDFLLFYYVFSEFFAMVDSRANNLVLSLYKAANGEKRWYPTFYDTDTIMGLNNEGQLIADFWVEYHDIVGSGYAFNGESSTLWNNVEQAYKDEIAALYTTLFSNVLTYENLKRYYTDNQVKKWCESIYNDDTMYKYIQPLLSGNGSYLYIAQGSREEQRKWWLTSRIAYLSGKYNTNIFLGDYVTMRLYTPSTWSGVPPSGDFRLTPMETGYSVVLYRNNKVSARLLKGRTTTVSAPDMQFNDTNTQIFGASNLKSLGDLSGTYCGTIDITKAINITELLIGSQVTGYKNNNLTSIAIANSTLLEKIDVSNCPNLIQPLDLSSCMGIQEVYAQGSGVTSIILPDGGQVRIIKAPAISTLKLVQQNKLTNDNLIIDGFGNLSTIVLVDCLQLDYLTIIAQLNRIKRARIIGISGTANVSDALFYISESAGIDANGNDVPVSVVEGTMHFNNIYQDDKDFFDTYWPDFHYTFDTILENIIFASSTVKSILVTNFDTNADGGISIREAKDITSFGTIFKNGGVSSFNEFRFFTGIVSLDDNAFNNAGVSSITFPNSLKSIGKYCFAGNRSISIYSPENITSIGDNAFESAGGADFSNFTSLETIGAYAFSSFIQSSITINSEALLSIGDHCFMSLGIGEGNLNGVIDLSACVQLHEIPAYAFNKTLTGKIILPDSIDTFGEYAFSQSKATSVNIPLNLINVASYAFNQMLNLVISDLKNIEYIGLNAFFNCTSLLSINGSKVSIIDRAAFSGCIALTSVSIPLCKEVRRQAFNGCTALGSISLPLVKIIEYRAFYGCNITDFDFTPVQSISTGAFEGVQISEMNFSNALTTIDTWTPIGLSYGSLVANITIPASVNKITNNGSAATDSHQLFYNCNNLKKVTYNSPIPLGSNTFYGCVSLTEIVLGESVTTLRANCLANCPLIETLILPESLTTIEAKTFADSSIKQLVLPASVIPVANAFQDSVIESLEINSSNTAYNLGVMPATLKYLKIGTPFTTLPSSILNASGLEELDLPGTITEINQYPFGYPTTWKRLTMRSETPPTISNMSLFIGSSVLDAIYVPADSLDAYKTAPIWSDFASVIQAIV